MGSGLRIEGLHLRIGDKTVLKNFSLEVPEGEMHALMGPNGAGKSSLSRAIAGHPDYHILEGDIFFNGSSLRGQSPEAIAQRGLFLAFQNPPEIEGLSVANFLRAALQARSRPEEPFSTSAYYAELHCCMDFLQIDHSFGARALHVGFSGGEKKRCELLQMLLLKPCFALLDEIDSGLDVDALRLMADTIDALRRKNRMGGLIITHYTRLLQYLRPDRVHVLLDGRIIRSGHGEIVGQIDRSGYQSFAPA